MNLAISCEVRGEQLLAKNLKRYFDHHHGSCTADEKNCRQVSCLKDTEVVTDDTRV